MQGEKWGEKQGEGGYMPDITMCQGKGCKKKKKCYRYLAEPSKSWQSYFEATPKGKCEYYIKTNQVQHKEKMKLYNMPFYGLLLVELELNYTT